MGIFFSLESAFFPGFDRGEFQLNFKTAPDASIDETAGRVKAVNNLLKAIPEVQHTYATIGAGDSGTVRDARIYVKLVERSKRKRHQDAIQRRRAEEAAGRRRDRAVD